MRRLNVHQFSRNLTIHVVLYGPPYPGKDINGKIVPYLAGPHASDAPLWHLPYPGEDKNGGKVPYLAGKTSTFLLSEAL